MVAMPACQGNPHAGVIEPDHLAIALKRAISAANCDVNFPAERAIGENCAVVGTPGTVYS
jgi:hypothetical protein